MISRTNIYRPGSKLHTIFNFIVDGKPHTLEAITDSVYTCSSASTCALLRRRTASALRTIRRDFRYLVFRDGRYCFSIF